MKASGAGSVMADRARGEVAGDDAWTSLRRRLELFPTAPWAARAVGEAIRRMDPAAEYVWECACGEGHMAAGLRDVFPQVHATDIFDWSAEAAAGRASCPAAGSLQHGPPLDFLSDDGDRVDGADWIITNPPFARAADFVAAGLRRAQRGVAVLCRSGWLDTVGRHGLFYGERPCDLELAFFERVPMALGRWEPRSTAKGGSTATAYSVFVWFQDRARPGWLRRAQVNLSEAGAPGIATFAIPPGTKARLTRPDDARLWATPQIRDDDLFAKPGRGE